MHPGSGVAGTCFPCPHSQHGPCVKVPSPVAGTYVTLQFPHPGSRIRRSGLQQPGTRRHAPSAFYTLSSFSPHSLLPKKKSPWSSQKHPTGRFAQFPSALPCISNLNLQHQRQQRKDEDGSYPSYSLCPWFICFVASWVRVHNFSPPPPTRTPLYHQSSCY